MNRILPVLLCIICFSFCAWIGNIFYFTLLTYFAFLYSIGLQLVLFGKQTDDGGKHKKVRVFNTGTPFIPVSHNLTVSYIQYRYPAIHIRYPAS